MERAFFIDKDGTIVDNSGYPEIIPTDKILDNVIEGLQYIKSKGYKIIIVSNQSWIAKGRMSKEEVERIFKHLIEKLKEKGIEIDDYFYCPHKSEDNCECKKPKPGLIFQAAKKYNINLSESYILGDMDDDILAGINAGVKTILVKTEKGGKFADILYGKADKILNSLNEIIDIL